MGINKIQYVGDKYMGIVKEILSIILDRKLSYGLAKNVLKECMLKIEDCIITNA